MHRIKYKTIGYLDQYPEYGDEILVKTEKGEFKARFCKWDWSDSSEEPYFQFDEGHEDDVIAWWYEGEEEK